MALTAARVLREINLGLNAARKSGVICGPVINLRISIPEPKAKGAPNA